MIIILVVLLLFAFSLRSHLLRYDYLFEFDALYHARMAEYIVTMGHVPAVDPIAYYQMGGAQAQQFTLYWPVSAAVYILTAFGQPFNLEFFMKTIQVMPAIFGALICFFMYFLGKEIFNSKKIGLVVAFIAAVTPAFAYRTMAGAQGDNSFGFLWFVLGLIFFVRAVKTNNLGKDEIKNLILGGLFFGIMAASWSMYVLIPVVLIPYFIITVLWLATQQEENHKPLLKNNKPMIFTAKVALVFAIFSIIQFLFIILFGSGRMWFIEAVGNISIAAHISEVILALAGIIAVVAIIIISYFLSKASKDTKKTIGILVFVILYLALIAMVFVFAMVPDLHDRSAIASQVGEESMGINAFGTKYNSLIIFPIVALIIFPLSFYLFRKDDSHTQIILFFWTLITLFMAWYWLKYTFAFGLGLVPTAGILCYVIFEGMKKFNFGKGIEAKAILAIFFFLMVLGVGATGIFMPDYTPYVDQNPKLVEAMNWINANTPQDAKIFNWWDQGHILAFLTNRKISTDNRNQSFWANKAMGLFVTTEDTNLAYSIASSKGGDYNLDADYIMLNADMFQQGPSFAYYILGKIDPNDSVAKKYYEGIIRVIPCSESGSNMNCGGNIISSEEFNKLPATWTPTPTQFYNGSSPMYFYRDGGFLFVLNNAANNSNLGKAWFNSAETANKYTEVFSNGQIKILKVIK